MPHGQNRRHERSKRRLSVLLARRVTMEVLNEEDGQTLLRVVNHHIN